MSLCDLCANRDKQPQNRMRYDKNGFCIYCGSYLFETEDDKKLYPVKDQHIQELLKQNSEKK